MLFLLGFFLSLWCYFHHEPQVFFWGVGVLFFFLDEVAVAVKIACCLLFVTLEDTS